MTGSTSAAPSDTQDADAALQATLAAWRSAGAWRLDPARFHALEALARRLPGQPEPVRRLLQSKLQAAVSAYAARVATAGPPAPAAPRRAPAAPGCVPLAQLNAYIRTLRPVAPATPAPHGAEEPNELASVRRFRRAWSSSRTQDQLEQAVSRQPANAGPLNSHRLVLQSLALMGEVSTDYLRRFLLHVEALQWLERAADLPRPAQARSAKTVRGTKATGRKPRKA
jgi:hypothetical protein